MPGQSHKKQNTKQFSIIDETVKTTDKIVKKKTKSKYPGLRKQLQNDEILKNYFVFDKQKDQLTTFRIEKGIQFGYNNIVTQKVQVLSESNNNQDLDNVGVQNDEMNHSHVLHQMDNQQIQLSNNNLPLDLIEDYSNQQEVNILLIQLFSLLIQHQQQEY